jgi:hypothetical protein
MMRAGVRLGAALPIALLGLAITAGGAGAAPQASDAAADIPGSCTVQPGSFTPGPAVTPPITLTPDLPAPTVNFGGGRGWKPIDVVLKASRPLPASFKLNQLDLEMIHRLVRQGDTATTAAAAVVRFTPPKLNPRRDMITFTICLNSQGIDAGHYTGTVVAEGPDGIEPATLSVSANAKDSGLFHLVVVIAGILVLFLLAWRGATVTQNDHAKEVARAVSPAGKAAAGDTTVSADVADMAAKVTAANARWHLKSDTLTNPFFWVSTVVSAAFAVAAAFTIYSQNTAWGSDPAVDSFAVASAVLAAAGFSSLLATGAGK